MLWRRNLLSTSSIRVGPGRVAPKSSYMEAKTGTTQVMMPKAIASAMHITTVG